MLLQGTVLVHHFALQHECVHYTAFRTRWVNDLVGQVCGLIIMLPHRFFRYEHCDHHTYTQLHDEDPEMISMPRTFGEYLWYLSALPYWRGKFTEIFRHATARLSEAEKKFIPSVEHKAVVLGRAQDAGHLCRHLPWHGDDGLVGPDLVLDHPAVPAGAAAGRTRERSSRARRDGGRIQPRKPSTSSLRGAGPASRQGSITPSPTRKSANFLTFAR